MGINNDRTDDTQRIDVNEVRDSGYRQDYYDRNSPQYLQGNQIPPYVPYPPRKNSNAGLIAAVSILAGVLVIGIVTLALIFGGVISFGSDKNEEAAVVQQEQATAAPQVPVYQHTENTVVSKNMYVANVKNSIYFRSEPIENDSNIICEIPLGAGVGFIENTDGIFAKIAYDNKIGYAKRQYLSDTIPYVSTNDTVSSYMYIANVKYSVYFRSQPVENDGNIICEIPLGTQVGLIERADGIFSKVRYNGQNGYVKTEYLSSNASASSEAARGGNTMTVVNVKYAIYLRSTPDEDSDSNIIMEIPVGAKVNYLGTPNSTFYKIAYGKTVGYSKQIYLAFD